MSPSSMRTRYARHRATVATCVALCGLLGSSWAQAQSAVAVVAPAAISATPDSLIAPAVPGAKPKVYGLVSAVGAQLHVVRLREQAGSNMEPYVRNRVDIPDQRLNFTVLRSIDQAVARVDPQAKRVLMQFASPNLDAWPANSRHEGAARALFAALKDVPARMEWDEIIAVTPRYAQLGENRMGDKLWGIGLYVQPLESNRISGLDGFAEFIDSAEDTVSTKGELSSATTFVAPYAYLRFTVLDAKTLQVLRTYDRLDSRKIADQKCAAIDVFKCFDAEQFGTMVEKITERAAVRGITGGKGLVDMPEPKRVN